MTKQIFTDSKSLLLSIQIKSNSKSKKKKKKIEQNIKLTCYTVIFKKLL